MTTSRRSFLRYLGIGARLAAAGPAAAKAIAPAFATGGYVSAGPSYIMGSGLHAIDADFGEIVAGRIMSRDGANVIDFANKTFTFCSEAGDFADEADVGSPLVEFEGSEAS